MRRSRVRCIRTSTRRRHAGRCIPSRSCRSITRIPSGCGIVSSLTSPLAKKLLASASLVGAAAAVAGLGSFAAFTDSTSANHPVDSGTVTAALGAAEGADDRLTIGATAVAAGDTIPRAGAVLPPVRSERTHNALLYGAPSLLVALMLITIWTPTRYRGAGRSVERVGLNALLDAVQADLKPRFDAICLACGSSTIANAPCPFCDVVVPESDRQLAVA